MRRLRRLGAAVAVIALALGVGWSVFSWGSASNVGELGFRQELRIPPVLEAETDGQGRKVFELHLQSGESELLPGKPAKTWGVNGAHLGPTLRAARGDEVTMRVSSGLPEATTLHWHGMHLPAAADGGPVSRACSSSTTPRPSGWRCARVPGDAEAPALAWRACRGRRPVRARRAGGAAQPGARARRRGLLRHALRGRGRQLRPRAPPPSSQSRRSCRSGSLLGSRSPRSSR